MNTLEAYKTLDGMVEAYNQLRAENNGHPISRSGRDLLHFHERAATTKYPKGDLIQAQKAFQAIIADYVTHKAHLWLEEQREAGHEVTRVDGFDWAVAVIESLGLTADVSQRHLPRDIPFINWE